MNDDVDYASFVALVDDDGHSAHLLTRTLLAQNAPGVQCYGDAGETKLVHFCHGAPGFCMLFCRAARFFADQTYFDAALNLGETVWRFGLIQKGPGLCHGVAGNGYVFLGV